MKIAISGSTGFIGSALVKGLESQGHTAVPMVRPSSRSINPAEDRERILYDPVAETIDLESLSRVDIVIHLAGESIAGLWTKNKCRRLVHSRVDSTRLIAQSMASLPHPPSLLITASAIGFYGSADQPVAENAPAGNTFLARLCADWESAVLPATQAGIRTVPIRLGMVLSPTGGSLKAMLPVFRLGLGAVLGHGRQIWSWITLDDVLGAVQWIIETSDLSGPVNFTGPNPVSNTEFTTALAAACGRRARLRIPAWALNMALDGFASETLLASASVLPDKLLQSGFTFRCPDLCEYFKTIRFG